MSWFHALKMWTPMVYSPKVGPDPVVAQKLEEKFQQAILQRAEVTRPPRASKTLPEL